MLNSGDMIDIPVERNLTVHRFSTMGRSIQECARRHLPLLIDGERRIPMYPDTFVILSGMKSQRCACCGAPAYPVCVTRGGSGDSKYAMRYVIDGGNMLTVDHIRPQSKSGRNDMSNYQPLCYYCNCLKGNCIVGMPRLRVWRALYNSALRTFHRGRSASRRSLSVRKLETLYQVVVFRIVHKDMRIEKSEFHLQRLMETRSPVDPLISLLCLLLRVRKSGFTYRISKKKADFLARRLIQS